MACAYERGECRVTVVGLDISTKLTGAALFSDGVYTKSKVLDCSKIKNTDERIKEMALEIDDVLREYDPDTVVIEETIYKNNIQTLKYLAYLAGSVISFCARNSKSLRMEMPSAWRKLVGIEQNPKIKREQLKQEAIDLVKKKYNIEVTDDEAEAILLCSSFFIY